MAWRDPANTPPVMVAVRAERAVMDWIAKLVMGGAKHAVVALVIKDLGLGSAWSDVVVVSCCLFRLFLVMLVLVLVLDDGDIAELDNVSDFIGLDWRDDGEKAWLSDANIAARMAMDAHDVFCLGVILYFHRVCLLFCLVCLCM
mmetsp:Transcript_12717/g.27433  ORF Transcript_12717/g.27433 Transcript_12717/m.27433 type:complete len:144 (+) Transcript_12717:1050-1481(+)